MLPWNTACHNEETTPMTDGFDQAPNPTRVFVIHGRNESARRAMFDFLRSIGLQPLEWQEAMDLTRVPTPYVGDVLKVAFAHAQAALVLMTPDEIAYLQTTHAHGDSDPETRPAPQARPNVLFEAGMALAWNEGRTVLTQLGDVRPFSDVGGRHILRLTNNVAARQDLARRLRLAGCNVNTDGTDWHTTGDFTPPQAAGDGLPLGRRIPSSNVRPAVEFALRYQDQGSRKLAKLSVINRGTETAHDVQLAVPDNAGLNLGHADLPIKKIPGGGRSVTILVDNMTQYFGGGADHDSAFDVTITARTDQHEAITQDVFIDLNG